MNVVSVSRRTDVPAFYWPWFERRVEAGHCHWVNPFNTHQVFKVDLSPESVAGFVFWTRNAAPMLASLDTLEKYAFYVQYTINGYDSELEAHAPNVAVAVRVVRELVAGMDSRCARSGVSASERVIWRYDPVILSSETPAEYHYERFAAIARQLEGYVEQAYFSFCDPYERTGRRFRDVSERLGWTFEYGDASTHREIASQFAEIARQHGMHLYSCAEAGLQVPAVARGSCIDPGLLARLRPDLDFHLKPSPTREGCGCVQAVDIGAFDTCGYGCVYCYATSHAEAARSRMAAHDRNASLLWRPAGLTDEELAGAAMQKAAKIDRKPDALF